MHAKLTTVFLMRQQKQGRNMFITMSPGVLQSEWDVNWIQYFNIFPSNLK